MKYLVKYCFWVRTEKCRWQCTSLASSFLLIWMFSKKFSLIFILTNWFQHWFATILMLIPYLCLRSFISFSCITMTKTSVHISTPLYIYLPEKNRFSSAESSFKAKLGLSHLWLVFCIYKSMINFSNHHHHNNFVMMTVILINLYWSQDFASCLVGMVMNTELVHS